MKNTNINEPQIEEAKFHAARSQLLDAFANLESEIVGFLKRNNQKISNNSLALKIRAVRTLPASSKLSKERRDKIQLALVDDTITKLLTTRANIVHSQLRFMRIGDETHGVFINAITYEHNSPMDAQVLNLHAIEKLIKQVQRLTKEIAIPPSLPPQPKPAATDGP